ncbi:MAG: ABC transporter substrate-binding protein [Clostridiales bacterium]|nr:ABC transporter substrate-binding protein [Clostridiales bacterium]
MKRIAALLLAAGLVFSCSACGTDIKNGKNTRIFTDSVGREVEVPQTVGKVAVSGPFAQIVLFALCPERLAGLSVPWDDTALPFIGEAYRDLPVLGQLYGGKGDFDPEALLASGANIVIDVGETKGDVGAELDALSEQTGIPFVHIGVNTDTMGEGYRMLGDLLGMEEEAANLASYCERVYADTKALSEKVEKKSLLYCLGDAGLHVITQGSYHSEVIDLLSDNRAVVDSPASRGTGNEVDMEQLLLWDPDVILFSPGSVFASAAEDPLWQQLRAVAAGTYYEVPEGPYNWLSFPPSVQRYLGMQWLAALLYPEVYEGDFYGAAAEYFRLFYHSELTREEFEALTASSLGKLQE